MELFSKGLGAYAIQHPQIRTMTTKGPNLVPNATKGTMIVNERRPLL